MKSKFPWPVWIYSACNILLAMANDQLMRHKKKVFFSTLGKQFASACLVSVCSWIYNLVLQMEEIGYMWKVSYRVWQRTRVYSRVQMAWYGWVWQRVALLNRLLTVLCSGRTSHVLRLQCESLGRRLHVVDYLLGTLLLHQKNLLACCPCIHY